MIYHFETFLSLNRFRLKNCFLGKLNLNNKYFDEASFKYPFVRKFVIIIQIIN